MKKQPGEFVFSDYRRWNSGPTLRIAPAASPSLSSQAERLPAPGMRQVIVKIERGPVLHHQNILEFGAKTVLAHMRLDRPQAIGHRAVALARVVPVRAEQGLATRRADAIDQEPAGL